MTRTFDLIPWNKQSIGFDSIFNELDRQFADNRSAGYPPYDIVKNNDNEYTISLAVAGFTMKDLSITQDKRELVVEGKAIEENNDVEYMHKGIAARSFARTFKLADYVDVTSAELENGLLHIKLIKEVPEELQPKQIAIGYSKS